MNGVNEARSSAREPRESGEHDRRIADDHAALRRVAVLVTRGEPPEAVFAAVAEQAGRVVSPANFALVGRYDADAVTVVGAWSRHVTRPLLGLRVPLGGHNVHTLVYERHEPVYMDRVADDGSAGTRVVLEAGARSGAGAPISMEGRLWGLVVVDSGRPGALPDGVEYRLAGFAELTAAAIANAQARTELRTFADEQAALRRIATLVAREATSEEVFAAVTEEAGRVLNADLARLNRYERDGELTVVADWTRVGDAMPAPPGTRLSPEGRNLPTLVFQTGQPARMDDYSTATGTGVPALHRWGLRAGVAAPVMVEGRPWGALVAGSRTEPLPPGTEERLAGFTELLATAIANAEARTALTASRARIVTAADTARRRIERDLHDGAQQRLVSLSLRLRALQAEALEDRDLARSLENAIAETSGALEELREIARGLHPAVLTDGGLRPALRALARRSAVPARLNVHVERRLPEPTELAAYYTVAEALTNTAKHARATVAEIEVTADKDLLRILVRDDGVGGAALSQRSDHGTGLGGLKDRLESLGGRICLDSPDGAGTSLRAELPLT